MGGRCTQATFLGGKPAKLRSTNKSSICTRCEESGLSPTDEQSAEGFDPKIETRGEEAKVRAFKDDLTVQLYLRKEIPIGYISWKTRPYFSALLNSISLPICNNNEPLR